MMGPPRRESTHGPIPSQSVVHRRDVRRARREAAGAAHDTVFPVDSALLGARRCERVQIYKDMTDLAFAEDACMVELQQQLIDSDPSGTPLVSLAFDRAALAARRIIKRKLKEEAQAAAAPVKSAERVASHGVGATA
jgi:Vanillate O-demethylase oxygenase C-terminal domain